MFSVFHLAWSTCRATKTFVAGWRTLLRKVERGSTLSNKFWLCCSFFIKLTVWRETNVFVLWQINQFNQSTAFLQPATNVFVADQVDHARWKTRNIDQNLQRNNVARQVEGFCISYFAVFKQTTTTTTTRTSSNKRFNEQNNSCARALLIFVHYFAVLCKTTMWNSQALWCLQNVDDAG